MDSVPACRGSYNHNQVAYAFGNGASDKVMFNDPNCHRVDQWIIGVAIIKVYLAAHCRNSKTIPVIPYPLDDVLEEISHAIILQIPETEGIQCGNRTCSHGKN